MTSKRVVVSVAYVAVVVQLAAYIAHDTGRLSDGPLYWTLLYADSLILLEAVLRLYRLRSHS